MTFVHDNLYLNNEDDILDEFLDQRVYDNLGMQLDKPDFMEFYDHDTTNNDSDTYFHDNSIVMDPASVDPTSIDPSPAGPSPVQTNHKLDHYSYDVLRAQISKVKFGKYDIRTSPDTIQIPPNSNLLDFSPQEMANLPYKLTISDLPECSRVETQIKLNFTISPPPPENLLYIPQDLVSKNKFCLSSELEDLSPLILKNLLHLDCYVMTSDLSKSCNICSKCIEREQKRASRRRVGKDDDFDMTPIPNGSSSSTTNGIIKNNPNTWADKSMIKKAIMFNSKEITSFPPPNYLDGSKSLELSARIICYCRHHQESEGFKLLFVLKNCDGQVVAKSLSSSIMIMDRKKPITKNNSVVTTPIIKREDHPISPNSVDESSDLTTNEDRNLKRKKLSIDDSNNHTGNPMYNGSVNGFSPVSNSDTTSSIIKPKLAPSMPESSRSQNTNIPTILRIIPAEGPVRGGIEVTLLGFNFNSSLGVKFGANAALATHCWSETTIVTYLPPAAQPGQVLVTFENQVALPGPQNQQIFTYTDDTDKQLIELALQIVGLKMNGKLEDAKNIARRIVGNDTASPSNLTNSESNPITPNGVSPTTLEWYNNVQGIVQKLTDIHCSTEDILINFLKLVDLPNCPIVIPNWQLSNTEGQTLLHLSAMKNYINLTKFLLNHGCKVDIKDNQGLTPLFYSSIKGDREMINLFASCHADQYVKINNSKGIIDYCDMNVLDMFSNGTLIRNGSFDSLNSMFQIEGKHISKMIYDNDCDSEFADSEYSENEEIVEESSIDERIPPAEDDVRTIKEASEGEDTDNGIWLKVKKVFNNSDDDLPNYDDLFPFGPSMSLKPKSTMERQLNNNTPKEELSDSSEDMIISYINHPRKTVENDKMLIFFWLPALLIIVSLFIAVSIGYRFESIEYVKGVIRDSLGNVMVGNERIKRIFNS